MKPVIQLAPVDPALAAPLKVGDEIEYTVHDKFTGNRSSVVLAVEQVHPDRVVFNGGARVERPTGEPLSLRAALVGDMDALSPPGGWGRDNLGPGAYWTTTHRGNGTAAKMTYALKAEAGEPTQLRTPVGVVPVIPIEYWGWATDKARVTSATSKVNLKVWYSPQLRRVIRLESSIKLGSHVTPGVHENSRELIELVAIRRR